MKQSPIELTADDIRSLHAERSSAIKQRLAEFASVPPSEYFYELAYCLLTPQSTAAGADKAVRLLRAKNFESADIEPEPLLHQKDFYIRFHKTKAMRLHQLKTQFPVIAELLANGGTSSDLRTWLVEHVKGLGLKEASHFLRNIGHQNLAILDRHILRNLQRAGILRKLPATLTAKRYLAIEKKFQAFSEHISIPMDELDLLFWSMATGEILK